MRVGWIWGLRLRYEIRQFGKRPVLGREKEIFFGIVLKEDLKEELWYGKVEAPIRVPEKYRFEKTDYEKIEVHL